MLYAVVLVTLAELAAAEFDSELHAKYLTMPESSFIEHFNAQGYSWKMAEYNDNIRVKYAPSAHFEKDSFEELPLQTHDLEEFVPPLNYDVRYGHFWCSSPRLIYDQGQCGSDWAFGTVTTASDRVCFRTWDGVDPLVFLSEQDLECSQTKVCGGGDVIEAFKFWRDAGLVTQACKPYNVTELSENQCVTKCVDPGIDYKNDKRYAESVYRISNNSDDIKMELFYDGSIQAGFVVYEDFFNYKSGIYEHTHGNAVGHHSVRLVGWGVDNGTEYWTAANSWGKQWGEEGWFRIKPYQEGIDFENYLITGTVTRIMKHK